MAEMQRTLVTKEGLENMQKELDELRSVKRATFRKTPNTMKRRMHRRSSKAASSSLNSRSVQHRSLKRERRTV